ncbi:STAS domain-containing protein [Saccharopolyspora mangrovi]|uniref:STAS domain-containing protein n=1 Tax=Saccharopolyspora mangrovi TaxID=3082379 RepID=A0ABU6AFE1_9PSEU|nr:STAS domain-containing protein [Saccharopolyspora sp. S2-29]MEB3370252.1 STAS domain-containing protein [Saccharopolyspora sp. S2-29]
MRAHDSLITTPPAVFAVSGDLVGAEVARLAERLWPHLLIAPPETLVDLATTDTVDAAGLDLLVAARTYAAHRDIALHLINAAPGVLRAVANPAPRQGALPVMA